MHPWTVKYRPQDPSQVQGQNKPLEILQDYIKDHKSKRPLLLQGPIGCGKTSMVYAAAKDMELIEINGSDVRDYDSIKHIVGGALCQQSLFFKKKIILVDEIDGISGRDRGGLKALYPLLKNPPYPLIMTANDIWNKKFSTLRKSVQLVPCNRLMHTSVYKVLKKICELENLQYDDSALKNLSRRAGGDLRGAIIDLQTISTGKFDMENLNELTGRASEDTMFNALMRIFKTTDPLVALSAFDSVNASDEEIMLWIDENLPKEYVKPKDLYRAYNTLSNASIFRRRIMRRQHWRFLSYIYQLQSAGIALSKDEKYPGFTKYTPTTRILKLWQAKQRNLKRHALAQTIAEQSHAGIKYTIKNVLPFFEAAKFSFS